MLSKNSKSNPKSRFNSSDQKSEDGHSTAPENLVVLVDENDDPVGTMEKLQAHQLGRLHRAFSVMLLRQVDSKWQVLLQQRNQDKYHCGGLWSNSCCSHPYPDEAVADAAVRRCQQELGADIAVHSAGHFVYRAELDNNLIEHEYDHVFAAPVAAGLGFSVNPNEIQDIKWVDIDQCRAEVTANPSAYTPWLLAVLDKVDGWLSSDFEFLGTNGN